MLTFFDASSYYCAMNSMTRKQRELHEREQLILDTAKDILQKEGFANLTMDRVAAEIEYSKGTVYNHFKNKEEIITGISCRCMSNIIELFTRAKNYKGSNRERISAVGIAHSLYAQLHPTEIENLQIIKSQAIRKKISIEKSDEVLKLEQSIISIVIEIVMDAVKDYDISAEEDFVPDGIVFGLWSMGYGSNLLHLSGTDFEKLGLKSPLEIMWVNSNKLLDSYNWTPLSSEFDVNKMREKLLTELFHEEMKQLEIIEDKSCC
jgi:AcrR family transcriptional regulator